MSLLREGQMIRGTYEVEDVLGEGAFAEVYLVRHHFLGRQAMKVFKAIGMTIEDAQQMLGEAAMLSRFGHPNIIHVFEANTTDTSKGICAFFTMEYVAGGSLDDFWRAHGNRFVPVATTVEIMLQVCQGLSVAHGENPPIVHRDVKPQNILVGYDAAGLRARVSDFGLAERVNPFTLMASAKGTLAFKAPEVFRDCQSDSCAGDVWALATTAYLLLTDRLPYPDVVGSDGGNGNVFEQQVIPPSKINLAVDPALDKIVLRGLASLPEDRYPSATEMLGDLTGFKSGSGSAPGKPDLGGRAGSSDSGKAALGPAETADESEARELVERAVEMARQASKLQEAADLLEVALSRAPELREAHEHRLRLWRKGVVR